MCACVFLPANRLHVGVRFPPSLLHWADSGFRLFFSLSPVSPPSSLFFLIFPSFWRGCWTCGAASPTERGRMCQWLSDFTPPSLRIICRKACWQIWMEKRSPDVWVRMLIYTVYTHLYLNVSWRVMLKMHCKCQPSCFLYKRFKIKVAIVYSCFKKITCCSFLR